MASKNILLYFLLIIFFLFLVPPFALTTKEPHTLLFSEEEADALDLSNLSKDDWSVYVNSHVNRSFGTRSLPAKSPKIEVVYPTVKLTESGQLVETQSPTKLIVNFVKPPAGEPIDMNTLEVTGRKGFLKKSLTNKLKPFIEGTTLEASKIKIPSGKFHLEVSISNLAGERTVENYVLVVK